MYSHTNGRCSLNLSNAVAIIAYEGMRQLDYPDLKAEGNWIQPK